MKNEILNLLKAHTDTYLSGEKISQMLGVSRTAIWKHIKQLKAEGYAIASVTNKGYKLSGVPSDLDSHTLALLSKEHPWIDAVFFHETIDSTNSEAKRLAVRAPYKTALIVSREQTGGKGRLGRNWESEKDAGVWMSLLLKPDLAPEHASKLTLVGAAAVCKAIETVTGLDVQIKWPNDIVIGGKKVCGILTEMSAELNHIHHLVLGIGINVKQKSFDPSIASKATSLQLEKPDLILNRMDLIEVFVKQFQMYYNHFVESGDASEAMALNRAKSATLNKDVLIIEGHNQTTAFATSIDDQGCLVVRLPDGIEKTIRSGEVSVRGLEGYI